MGKFGVVLLAAILAGCTGDRTGADQSATNGSQGDPPTVVEIVDEVVTSTEGSQTFPAIDPTTGDLWYSEIGESFDEQTILVARRTAAGWATPEVASFSGRWGDRAPRFSPDGSFMLITSNRPVSHSDEGGDMNVWRLDRAADGWSDPRLVETELNSDAPDIHPSITNSGIWVASRRDGSLGQSDLYRIDAEGRATHLGAPLNDELSQPDLWVSPDETWMILAITDHPEGFGGDDLYVTWLASGQWVTPVNLGPEINTAEYEYGPWVSLDEGILYFTSHRDGPSHVYRVDLSVVDQIKLAH